MQSITSNLMPATVPPPRKPTPEELKAKIKKLDKRIKRSEQKHQRHHDMFVTKPSTGASLLPARAGRGRRDVEPVRVVDRRRVG